jgi:hypothetical protein
MSIILVPTNAICRPVYVDFFLEKIVQDIKRKVCLKLQMEGAWTLRSILCHIWILAALTRVRDSKLILVKLRLSIPKRILSPPSYTQDSLSGPHVSAADTAPESRVVKSLGGDFLLAPASLSGSGATGSASPTPGVATRPGTGLQHGIWKPQIYTNGTMCYGLYTSSGEPQNDHEGLQDDKWKKAMDDEFGSLQRNDTWHLVPTKSRANVIDCKWVHKIKRKSDGTIDRYKARLVAKGMELIMKTCSTQLSRPLLFD